MAKHQFERAAAANREFWRDHRVATDLLVGSEIVDPHQSDFCDSLIQVQHVDVADSSGMVSISGVRGSGTPCKIAVAFDWPLLLRAGVL